MSIVKQDFGELSGGEGAKFIYSEWSTTQVTYTFTENYKYVYISTCKMSTSPSEMGTYTGNGTAEVVSTNATQIVVKITNVSSGDTYKAPTFTTGSVTRCTLSIVGE